MKMKWLMFVALLTILTGGILVIYAHSLPVYTYPEARDQISADLGAIEQRDQRFAEWYSRLSALETPHKKFADLGRGLVAGGLGLITSLALVAGYNRFAWLRRSSTLYVIWATLWLVRIPLSFWYYELRQLRGDYPSWGDSIAIPIFSEILSWGIGLVVSSFTLLFLLGDRSFPQPLQFSHPRSMGEWIRLGIIFLWLMLNALCVYSGIRYGSEGMAFSCLVASVILVIFLSAKAVESPKTEQPVG